MGAGLSSAEKTVTAEDEECRRKADEQRIREMREEIARRRQEQAERAANERKRRDEELRAREEEGLRRVMAVVEEVNERRVNGHAEIDRAYRDMDKEIEQRVEMTKRAGVEQARRLLDQGNEELREAAQQLTATNEHIKKEELEREQQMSQVRDETKAEEFEAEKRHEENMLKMVEQRGQTKAEGAARLVELEREHKERLKPLQRRQKELHSLGMEQSFAAINAHERERGYEDFRRNCKRLVTLFKTFNAAFSREQGRLISVRDQMEQRRQLTRVPDLTSVNRKLRSLHNQLTGFTPGGARDPTTFENLRDDVLEEVGKLMEILNEIDARIGNYTAKEKSPEIPEPFEIGPVDGIATFYQEAKDILGTLTPKMLKFNVSASTELDDLLSVQFQTLTLEHSRNISGQIAYNGQQRPEEPSTEQRGGGQK